MARYSARILSQATQLSGVNATTTVNGYMGYLGASATAGFRLRRITLGMIFSGAITSQQIEVGVYRQTVAPAGTGIAAAVAGGPLETWTPADPTGGVFAITATTIGTTGPTLTTATVLPTLTFNSQTWLDYPVEAYEELVCGTGTANGIAFVNLANTLPSGGQIVIALTWEV